MNAAIIPEICVSFLFWCSPPPVPHPKTDNFWKVCLGQERFQEDISG
jgi:hypothetical protein